MSRCCAASPSSLSGVMSPARTRARKLTSGHSHSWSHQVKVKVRGWVRARVAGRGLLVSLSGHHRLTKSLKTASSSRSLESPRAWAVLVASDFQPGPLYSSLPASPTDEKQHITKNSKTKMIQGVPKKLPHVLNGYNSHNNGTRDKKNLSFEKFNEH